MHSAQLQITHSEIINDQSSYLGLSYLIQLRAEVIFSNLSRWIMNPNNLEPVYIEQASTQRTKGNTNLAASIWWPHQLQASESEIHLNLNRFFIQDIPTERLIRYYN